MDRRRAVRLVFHLRLGQRGSAVDAPVDRFLAAVDEVLLDELPEGADDSRLVGVAHRQVRLLPGAEDAEATESVALNVDVLLGVLPAGAAQLHHWRRRRAVPLAPRQLAFDLQLDGQAVAVPPRDVRRVEPRHGARADDDVLQDLVERGADVDLAVRVRRSVVQDVAGCPGAVLTDLPVQIGRFPAGDHLRFSGRQARLHAEGGLRQVERIFQIRHGGTDAPARLSTNVQY